jgi:hypothetical protein
MPGLRQPRGPTCTYARLLAASRGQTTPQPTGCRQGNGMRFSQTGRVVYPLPTSNIHSRKDSPGSINAEANASQGRNGTLLRSTVVLPAKQYPCDSRISGFWSPAQCSMSLRPLSLSTSTRVKCCRVSRHRSFSCQLSISSAFKLLVATANRQPHYGFRLIGC